MTPSQGDIELAKKLSTIPPSGEFRVEAQMDPQDLGMLLKLVGKVTLPNMVIVEVGCWQGGTSIVLGGYLREQHGTLYCVDIWEEEDVLNKFLTMRRKSGSDCNMFVMIMPSLAAAAIFADYSADLVFVDASHKYSDVKSDIIAWMPKVRHGGILCGHDCEGKFTGYTESQQRDIDRDKEEEHSHLPVHPGVIKALYDIFYDEYEWVSGQRIWWKTMV